MITIKVRVWRNLYRGNTQYTIEIHQIRKECLPKWQAMSALIY